MTILLVCWEAPFTLNLNCFMARYHPCQIHCLDTQYLLLGILRPRSLMLTFPGLVSSMSPYEGIWRSCEGVCRCGSPLSGNDCDKWLPKWTYQQEIELMFRRLVVTGHWLATMLWWQLIDFRFAKQMSNERTFTITGMADFLAPEIIQGQGHSLASDWCVIVIYISGHLSFIYLGEPLKPIYQE